MKRLTPVALIFSAALLACAQPAAAQEARPAPAPKNLAVEVDADPEHQVQVKGGLETGRFRRLPGHEQPAGAARLVAVKYDAVQQGDAVLVSVRVVYDDSQPADAPGPKYGRKLQSVGSYLVREGEPVRVEDLTRFGVEPVTLKAVQARPRPAPPALAATPLVVNNLKGVQVVSFHPDAAAPPGTNNYRLRLHNVTTKAVSAISYKDDDGMRSITLGNAARPLVAPGDIYNAPVRFNVSNRATPGGLAHDAERQRTLTVSTVVFADETYEGEADVAATIIAQQRGEETQRARILSLLRAHLAAPTLDATAALPKLKTEVESLRIDADPAVVAELSARFPSPGRDAVRRLSSDMMSSLKSTRELTLGTIRQWEEEMARTPAAFDPRARLASLVERLERGGRY